MALGTCPLTPGFLISSVPQRSRHKFFIVAYFVALIRVFLGNERKSSDSTLPHNSEKHYVQ